MPETFAPVTLANNTGQPLNASYFNRLETNLETFDDRITSLESTTVVAANPPPGLNPVTFNNVTDDRPALQACLDYVKATWGGGRVVLSKPNGTGVRIGSGLSIPAGVQLWSDEKTLLNASTMPPGSVAITVDDVDFTPLVGIRMDGGNFNPPADPGNTSVGISVTGRGLRFENLHLQYFGRGVDYAHNNTFGVTFAGGHIDRCGTCAYGDLETAGAGNAGEKIVFKDMVFANSNRGFNASAGGQSLRLQDCSIDFCTELGRAQNATVHFSGHLETGGTGAGPHLFDLTGNAQFYISDTSIIMGGGRPGGLYHIANPSNGPSNYSFGAARFDGVSTFYVDPAAASRTVKSEEMVPWEAGITTKTFYTPYPLRWSMVSAEMCVTDGYTQPTIDNTIRITGMTPSTGQITLTSAVSHSGQRWVKLKF